jgi:glyoxylate reductase
MPDKKPLVVVTRKLPEPVEARMRDLFDVRLNPDDIPMPRAALIAAVQQGDVLVPTVTDKIDAELIAAAGAQLKMIANFGAGVNHIDIDAAFARGLTVTNTPGVLTDDTADMTMALLLAVPRRLLEGARAIQAGEFKGWHPTWMMGSSLRGKNLGIVGMGRIGQAVARRAKAFGMNIHYHNRRSAGAGIEQEFGATYWDDLDAMIPAMDFVSLNCPYTPATFHLMSAERLARMKPSAYLVNTARGEVVDEAALAEALLAGRIAGAGLDVFEREPEIHPKLMGLKNVVLLPHLGSGTIESRTAMGEKVIINIQTYFNAHRPPDRVIPAIM